MLCSRQPRTAMGTDAAPVARVTEGFSHWVARAIGKAAPAATCARAFAGRYSGFATSAISGSGNSGSVKRGKMLAVVRQAYTNGASHSNGFCLRDRSGPLRFRWPFHYADNGQYN